MVQDPLRGRLVPVHVKALLLDPTQNTPVLILQEEVSPSQEGARILPIWIGLFEATAIQMHLEGTELRRPFTHDLMIQVLAALESRLLAVVVHTLENGTFFASLRIQQGDEHLVDVDARPSDAIALGLRAEAELFVSEDVFAALDGAQGEGRREAELKEWFENLDPDDLGQYTM
jgi:bifunctional DNase/RNase